MNKVFLGMNYLIFKKYPFHSIFFRNKKYICTQNVYTYTDILEKIYSIVKYLFHFSKQNKNNCNGDFPSFSNTH